MSSLATIASTSASSRSTPIQQLLQRQGVQLVEQRGEPHLDALEAAGDGGDRRVAREAAHLGGGLVGIHVQVDVQAARQQVSRREGRAEPAF